VSNDLLDLGGAEDKAPISLNQTKFSLKQFTNSMGRLNRCAFNNRKEVWVVAIPDEKNWGIMQRKNSHTSLQNSLLTWSMSVQMLLVTFNYHQLFESSDSAQRSCLFWIGMEWMETECQVVKFYSSLQPQFCQLNQYFPATTSHLYTRLRVVCEIYSYHCHCTHSKS